MLNQYRTIFLFPSDYFARKQVDRDFLKQMTCLQNLGFATSVISLESLRSQQPQFFPALPPDSIVVYRGWMLTSENYSLLTNIVREAGANMLVSPAEYITTHYLPNWYPLLADLTPETRFFALDRDLESELQELGWESFFVKDWVKSLKTSIGSIVTNPAAINTVVAEMKKFRGTIEGGLCVRRVEDFLSETERRYFVLHGETFTPSPDLEIPEIVRECAKRIESSFFSVDIIERKDGCLRIVEIGDGQVSDLVGWSEESFANLWRSKLQ